MIKTLYPTFRRWTEKGSLWIISDTHFEDSDCEVMSKSWITPEEHLAIINQYVHKNDTLYYKTHEDLGCFQEHSGWNIPIHSQHMINVYPNPTHLFLTLEILSEDMGDGFVVIQDLMGHECFQMNIYDRVSVLPLASLSSGMYLLTFTNRRGNTFTKRIVIK